MRRSFLSLAPQDPHLNFQLYSPKARAKDKTKIHEEDLIGLEEYSSQRKKWIQYGVQLSKSRRIYLGPHVGFTFTNFDLMWIQVMELILAEKQSTTPQEQLDAFNPLVPRQSTLFCSMMIEIPNKVERVKVLQGLSNIENSIYLQINGKKIKAKGTNFYFFSPF